MPTFQDSAFIFFLALLLFGPKKLPELARYVGKLMNEFRRASNEFRTQMEDELRVADQAEQQKKIAALTAAAPPVIAQNIPEPEHPHLDPVLAPVEIPTTENRIDSPPTKPGAPGLDSETRVSPALPVPTEPLPIATAGDLHLMPPATGLPVARSNGHAAATSNPLTPVFDAIPQTPDPATLPDHEPATHV